jgi:hypothetical protein
MECMLPEVTLISGSGYGTYPEVVGNQWTVVVDPLT